MIPRRCATPPLPRGLVAPLLMQITLRPIDSITPYDKNPHLNDGAVEAVARSLRKFGWRQPIVVDKDSVIVVGHTRWKAAKSLGMTEVPVHVADNLTPEQARAYRIADNQTASISEWYMELLPLELAELKDLGIDMTLLGWDPGELKELMAPQGNAGLTDSDDVPAPPDAAITQPGDLWILGNHRLLCGDSANAADVDRLLDGQQVHLVNTDPPYNVKVEPRSNNVIVTAGHAGAPPFSSFLYSVRTGRASFSQGMLRERSSSNAEVLGPPRSAVIESISIGSALRRSIVRPP